MSPEYMAGFVDGEGCLDVQRMYASGKYSGNLYVRPRLRVAQAMSGRLVLDILHATFGGHLSVRKAQTERQQDSLSWELLSDADLRRIIPTILPHLIVKLEQARLMLWWLDNTKGMQTHLNPGIGRARAIFAEEMAAMKRDPQRLSEGAVARIELSMR